MKTTSWPLSDFGQGTGSRSASMVDWLWLLEMTRKKTWQSQIFQTSVEPVETNVSPANTRHDSGLKDSWLRDVMKERLQFNTSLEDVRRDENWQAPFWEWAQKRGLTPDVNLWRWNQQTSMLELQPKTRKKIQGLWLLCLSPHDMLFLFIKLTQSTQLSPHPHGNLKCIVANKLLG